jgi:sorting nexin-8
VNKPQPLPPLQQDSRTKIKNTFDGASDDTSTGTPEDIQEEDETIRDEGSLESIESVEAEDARSNTTLQVLKTEIDPNYSRRKRRKTSPIVLSQDNGDSEGLDRSRSRPTQQSWQAQLQEEAKMAPDSSQTAIAAGTPSSNSSLVQSSPARARRSPRHVKHETNESMSAESDNPRLATLVPRIDATAEIKLSLRSPKSTPPKKRMLKLSASGKLLSSPKQPSPVSKLAPRPAPSVRLKHGKLTPSMPIALRYGVDKASRSRIGNNIANILQTPRNKKPEDQLDTDLSSKMMHPFFLGKLRPKKILNLSTTPSDLSTTGQDSERDGSISPQPKRAPEWKDLVFMKKPTHIKVPDVPEPLWPPNELQPLGRDSEPMRLFNLPKYRAQKSKAREHDLSIDNAEDILHSFTSELFQQTPNAETQFNAPERRVTSGRQILRMIEANDLDLSVNPQRNASATHEAIVALQDSMVNYLSPFDLGRIGCCQDWPTKYAPSKTANVLPTGCEGLRDWLSNLSVDRVKARADSINRPGHPNTQSRRKRRRMKADDLDDFIASSDDESHHANGAVKNVILLSGPSGCGKTASVYAIANELNFEIFEIHPGMRRSAKDIFDKVGDMTQNHLVQQAAMLDTKPTAKGFGSSSRDDHPGTKMAVKSVMNNLFGTKGKAEGNGKAPKTGLSKDSDKTTNTLKSQKESLVLFEEVDILFEEDRSFWSGVLTLIEQSKRPVILTCNDSRDVPLEDLSPHAILHLEPPLVEVATEYLLSVAAKEGHLLERTAISALYNSRGRDIRASLTELNFWCQMTLGSQQGGLDWMLDRKQQGSDIDDKGEKLRVCSKDTFTQGLNLYPHTQPITGSREHEESLEYACHELQIPTSYWHETQPGFPIGPEAKDGQSQTSQLDFLCQMENLADSRSVLDLASDSLSPKMGIAITNAFFPETNPPTRAELVQAHLESRRKQDLGREELIAAFEPVIVENSILSLGSGRLAPSFDGPTSTIAIDIAPYIRSIVSFDQRLEQQRDGLAGRLQGKKTRTTRAARAALEGGSKASTRRERWFPSCTDFNSVLRTGGDWPKWYAESEMNSSRLAASSPESDSTSRISLDDMVSNDL